VLRRATPLIFANALVPLVGVIDVAVIGYTGDAVAIAGVGLGAIVFSYVQFGLYFLRMSTTGLVAQAPQDDSLRDPLGVGGRPAR
jgi:MATE family multidrug resistance protein